VAEIGTELGIATTIALSDALPMVLWAFVAALENRCPICRLIRARTLARFRRPVRRRKRISAFPFTAKCIAWSSSPERRL